PPAVATDGAPSAAAKRRLLQAVRATTCYPRLRAVLLALTIVAVSIEVIATLASLSTMAFLFGGDEFHAPIRFASPALLAVAVCPLELLFTIALYGLLRTVIDLADLSLHRDAGAIRAVP